MGDYLKINDTSGILVDAAFKVFSPQRTQPKVGGE
jgi:hypothetical protein